MWVRCMFLEKCLLIDAYFSYGDGSLLGEEGGTCSHIFVSICLPTCVFD